MRPLPLILVCLACAACAPEPQLASREFLAMGTTISIEIVAPDPNDARQIIDATRDEFLRIGREWYAWANDGELVRLNAAIATGHASTVSPELAALLQRAQTLSQDSEGCFDPALGKLVRLWGFDSAERTTQSLPSAKQLSAWRMDHPTMADVHIEATQIQSARSDLILDLGAIGKGYAVDRAMALLRSRGIDHAMVNAGGNLRAIGSNVAHPWRIAIRDPRAVRTLGWLELSGDESVATSGDYERFAIIDGRRIHHLLDPRSGEVAVHTIAVTVIAPDATTADAASTALFVAGPDHWQNIARKLHIEQALRIDANGEIEVSRKLEARLRKPSSETRQTKWRVVDL